MKIYRIFMNSYDDAFAFCERICPICSHIRVPKGEEWLLSDEPFKLTINYKQPTMCIEIYKNKVDQKVRNV